MNSFTWGDGGIVEKLEGADKRAEAFIHATVVYHASRAQTYARQNAPWTDRTSNARNGLFGRAAGGGKRHALIVGGTVSYQPYLEARWSGRYAIIGPTLKHEGPELMKTLQQGFGKIFGG